MIYGKQEMAVVYLPNELLNFTVCASKQLNASTLTSIIGGFYHDDELTNSKAELSANFAFDCCNRWLGQAGE